MHCQLDPGQQINNHVRIFNVDLELRAIPGSAAYPQPDTSTNTIIPIELARPVVVDSQETGVQLVHTLMACVEQQENSKVADALVKHLGLLAASQAGTMKKVATYFAEAVARRIYRIYPQDCLDSSYNDILHSSKHNKKHTTALRMVASSSIQRLDFGGLGWILQRWFRFEDALAAALRMHEQQHTTAPRCTSSSSSVRRRREQQHQQRAAV